MARTKYKVVIVNAIEPLMFQQFREVLNKINFVTISIATSNRKIIKTVPCVVWYFATDCGVKVELLDYRNMDKLFNISYQKL